MELLNGKVKYSAGNPRHYEWGDRVNVVIDTQQGEIRVWGDANDPTLLNLRRGQEVTLAKAKKNWQVTKPLATAPSMPKTAEAIPTLTAATPNDGDMLNYAKTQAELMRQCHEITELEFSDRNLNTEDLRTLSITLFLSIKKKFGI